MPAAIGSIEKMSKSKKNLVDPDDIIAHYGADCARWFMLSDSPPERDVIWTEAGVAGAGRFIQRIWRIVDEIADKYPAKLGAKPATFGPEALEVRKAAHRALDQAGKTIEGAPLQRRRRPGPRIRQCAPIRPIQAGRRPRLGGPGGRGTAHSHDRPDDAAFS